MAIILRPRSRSRGWYILAVVLTIAAGLASRRFPEMLPTLLGKYPGDALWALMVFFGWGIAFRSASSLWIATLALATAYSVELLKLWQSPWWEEVRHSTMGHLVFGHAFCWQNFVAYAFGVACGLTVEIALAGKKGP